MPSVIVEDSVGIVNSQIYTHTQPFTLQCGTTLPSYELVYETYGVLNENKSNAILVCHALSGHHHAAGYHSMDEKKPGWWDTCIGPNKPIDTNIFYVVSVNNLGGCHGSTGPLTLDPETQKLYGPSFPSVLVRDWVVSQSHLADHLGIHKFAAIVGGSLGGMQALQWTIDFPNRVHAALLIACAAKLSAQNIAFNEIARQAITTDPNFFAGRYVENSVQPSQGLMLARMIGHVTYLSDDGMRERFGRELKSGDLGSGGGVEFQVESYLHYQGRAFSKHFDANTYVLMTKALDYFDPARETGNDLVATFAPVKAKFLVLSFSSDWRFPVERSREIVNALIEARKNVAAAEIESDQGHDSFLLPIERYVRILRSYLIRIADEVCK